MTKGAHGRDSPTPATSAGCRTARYNSLGEPRARCISFARIGRPELVFSPEITHEFDALVILSDSSRVAAASGTGSGRERVISVVSEPSISVYHSGRSGTR